MHCTALKNIGVKIRGMNIKQTVHSNIPATLKMGKGMDKASCITTMGIRPMKETLWEAKFKEISAAYAVRSTAPQPQPLSPSGPEDHSTPTRAFTCSGVPQPLSPSGFQLIRITSLKAVSQRPLNQHLRSSAPSSLNLSTSQSYGRPALQPLRPLGAVRPPEEAPV